MKNISAAALDFLLSLRTALWSLWFLMSVLLVGAVIMPLREEFASIHTAPLLVWLRGQPFEITWWLWAALAALALLAAGTFFCSIESVVRKTKGPGMLLLISPQIIHAGFLCMLLAHLLSSMGGSQFMSAVRDGAILDIPDAGMSVRVEDISVKVSPEGYVTDWAVGLSYSRNGIIVKTDRAVPNGPSLYKGLNIGAKQLQAFPEKAVLLQISRDPGAPWALAGGILFLAGTIVLIALRIRTARE